MVGGVVDDTDKGSKGRGFDSRARPNGRSVANGSPPLRRFFEAIFQALSREDGPRCTLRRNTARMM